MKFVPFRWKNNVERFLCNLYKLEWNFCAAQEIWVLIAHGKCIFNHLYWCSGDSVRKFGMCLHLHTYFVYKSSKGYVVSNYTISQGRLLLHSSTLGYEPKSNVLAHLIYYLFTIYNQFKNSRWVWSGNTTITNCRQPRVTARKSHSTIKKYQEDKLSKAISSLPHQDDCNTRMDIK